MNMIDYIQWRGDLTMKQDDFNIVDNLILSYISYVDFNGVFDDNKKLTLQQACEKFYQLHTLEEVYSDKSFIAKAPIVLEYASKSNRFKDLVLHDYVDVLKKEESVQFSAIQFDFYDDRTYIAFRGTDDTLIGWKEDLLLSYKTVTAQLMAANYINERTTKRRKYYVGGHSKGGCLAVYGASQCENTIKNRIVHIYNNDGPNLNESFVTLKSIEESTKITTRVVPGFSVFGMIFASYPCNTVVIKSDNALVLQHDAISWQIEGKRFIELEDLTNESKYIKDALDRFVIETTAEEKAIFIDELFTALDEAGLNKVSDISKQGPSAVMKIFKEVLEINSTAKKVGAKLLDVIRFATKNEAFTIKESTTDYIKDKVNDAQEFISDKIEDVHKSFNEKVENVNEKLEEKKEKILAKLPIGKKKED